MIKSTFKIVLLTIIFFVNSSFLNVSENKFIPISKLKPPFYNSINTQWVDSTLSSMSLEQRIGQLFMVAAYSNKGEEHKAYIEKLIKEYNIGGLIFFQGGPVRQIRLTNHYQEISKTPLLIAIDGEWGLAMRLDSTIKYPRQMILGAINNDTLLYEMGKEIALDCKRMGIQVNFAPVIDINNNPNNPVIGSRSFGEDRFNVALKGYQYMKGLQDNKVLATGKHFPGHGDTNIDSHKALPTINHNRKRLDSLELFPFSRLIKQGLGGIMVAHLYIPALDSTKNTATTLSSKVVNGLLKNHLGFEGLIFTDALNMKGISNYYKPGEADLKAFMAGNDILLYPKDVKLAINKIKQAVIDGRIDEEDLNRRVSKILAVKYWSGLNKLESISEENIYKDLNRPSSKIINRKLIENSLTVIKNSNDFLPLKRLDTLKIAVVSIGDLKTTYFQKTANKFTKVDFYNIKKFLKPDEQRKWVKKLAKYNTVIVSLHKTNFNPKKNYGLSKQSFELIDKFADNSKVILNLMALPYAAKNIKNFDKINSIIISYNDTRIYQVLSAQLIFGSIKADGKLPVSINENYPAGFSIVQKKINRLKYSIPAEVGANSIFLNKIDSIALSGIREHAYPGCQVLIAKNGIVFYNKSFGHFTYDRKHKVTNDDIYDLASITKIGATTLSLMSLYDDKKVNVNNKISQYISYLDTTNKSEIIVKDILMHQAQLIPWIPFYISTIDNPEHKKQIYRNVKTTNFNTEICNNFYILDSYLDSINMRIASSNLRKKNGYRYSDIGYYWFKQIVENQTGLTLDKYVQTKFYNTIGAQTLTYNPLNTFNKSRIAPTEKDEYWRNQVVQGYVHDMGSAMMGGVGGHAGLFSNANDLAKLMQMLLNKGSYGGVNYIKPKTIELFTSCLNCPENRRGLGFDKPLAGGGGPTSILAPANSFGHTGFTGTMAWVDPKNDLVYIFLSNRTYPNSDNNKIIELDIRTKIQEAIYNSFDIGLDSIN